MNNYFWYGSVVVGGMVVIMLRLDLGVIFFLELSFGIL